MNFSLRRIEGVNMQYSEERRDSELQVIFCPGGFNPDLWRHQMKYFSGKVSTVGFQPLKSSRGYEGEKEALDAILDQGWIDNAVLVSNILGNPLIQSFEDRENVKTTVLTGPLSGKIRLTTGSYSLLWKALRRNPKIMKKIFFSGDTDYRVVRRFAGEVNPPEFQTFREYESRDTRRPVKISLTVHPERDRFSSIEYARNLNTRLSVIRRAGTFPFYEKPQEFNKALSDFLEMVEQEISRQKAVKSAEKNRSLEEFQSGKVRLEK